MILTKFLVWGMFGFLSFSCIEATSQTSAKLPTGVVDVQSTDLLTQQPDANWLSYNGDYSGRRYSSLTQITPANVAHLRPAWMFQTDNGNILEVTPIVVNGVMFIAASNNAYALDAHNGRELWHFSHPVSERVIGTAAHHRTRGIAILGTKLYLETDNAHLLCLDARSGALLWDVAYADENKDYGSTGVPLIVKGKVIVGSTGGDDGERGFIAAYDAQTGKQVWRFWTIPAPGEFGSSSWPGDMYLHGGGSTWMPGTFDPELNTLYWTTSNPAPDFNGEGRPGDDLYTDCVLALDLDTGKLKWHFQFTPHDVYDFDSTQTPVLMDAVYQGQQRKLLVQANRNGFLYVLDRTNGKFLSATPFVNKLNWAKGVDATGRPILTGAQPTAEGMLVCPEVYGATNWWAPSYNKSTHLLYVMAEESCSIYKRTEQKYALGKTYYSGTTRREPGAQKVLEAIDPLTGASAWKYPQAGTANSFGGAMSTASGLVFFGNDTQELEAADGITGKSLWHFNTGQTMHASPMTYSVDGAQYVAIVAGKDLIAFSLP